MYISYHRSSPFRHSGLKSGENAVFFCFLSNGYRSF